MNWTEYPTKDARKNQRGGVPLTGQYVSPGPGGTKWYMTADKKFHAVRTYHGAPCCVLTECLVKPR